jgi:hypothetical protein
MILNTLSGVSWILNEMRVITHTHPLLFSGHWRINKCDEHHHIPGGATPLG